MPDIPVVLGDGPIAGEEPAAGGVHQHLPGPERFVSVVVDGPVPGGDIALHVQQGHEPVLAGDIGPQGLQGVPVPVLGEDRVKQEVQQIVTDEMERIKNDPDLQHLIRENDN